MTARYVGPQRITRKLTPPMNRRHSSIRETHRNILPLLAFDPGGTTGWSLIVLPRKINGREVFAAPFDFLLQNKLKWEHGEFDTADEDLMAYEMAKLVDEWPSAAIIVEDFILRIGRYEKSRNLLSPVRLTAKLEYHMYRRHRRHFILQSPSMAKTTVTDSRLKLWNCYEPGLPHARDADKHVLTMIRRCYGTQGVPQRISCWPHVYGFKEGDQIPGEYLG